MLQIKACREQLNRNEKYCALLKQRQPTKKRARSKRHDVDDVVGLAGKTQLSCTRASINLNGTQRFGLEGSFRNVLQFLDRFSRTNLGTITNFECKRASRRRVVVQLGVR